MGMIAHGLWDMSLFLPAQTGTIALLNLAVQVLVVVVTLIAAVIMLRRDRKIPVTGTGLQVL